MAKLISLWAQVVWVLTEAMPWCIPKGTRGFPKEMPFYLDLEKEMWSHYAWRRKGAFQAKGGIQGQDPYFFTCGWNSHVSFMSEESSPAFHFVSLPRTTSCWNNLRKLAWKQCPLFCVFTTCSRKVGARDRKQRGRRAGRGTKGQDERQPRGFCPALLLAMDDYREVMSKPCTSSSPKNRSIEPNVSFQISNVYLRKKALCC